MGMGDSKAPYEPKRVLVRCDVSGLRFPKVAVRECKEPHILARYGTGGKVNVSVWVCRKCKYCVTYPMHGGISCGLDNGIQART